MQFKKVLLLVEDNPDDASLLELTPEMDADMILRRVENGGEAVEYLEGKGLYSMRDSFPLPTMILLHLKLPDMKGFELLEWLKHQGREELKGIPVIALTGSNLKKDAEGALGILATLRGEQCVVGASSGGVL